jgi:hypothetical protein
VSPVRRIREQIFHEDLGRQMDIAQPLGDERCTQGRLRLPPSERAARTRAGDCYSGAPILRDCGEYADHSVTRCRIQELNIRSQRGYGNVTSNDLSRLKHRQAVTNKEFRGGDFTLCCVHLRAECEAGGGIVARQFVGRERAAEGSPMANSRVADVSRQVCQHRQPLPQNDSVPAIVRPLVARAVLGRIKKLLWHQGILRHPDQEILESGLRDWRAVLTFMGDGPFFFCDEPTGVDAIVFGPLAASVLTPIESPIRDFLRSQPVFVAYADRMLVRFFPELAPVPSREETAQSKGMAPPMQIGA